jgi:hypothetical protein
MQLNDRLALIEDDAHTWGSVPEPGSYARDLIALRPRVREDPFSHWVAKNAIVSLVRCGCARFRKPSGLHGLVGYKDTTIFKITSWMTSMLASVIPVLSVVILNRVSSITTRLALIGAFNILMSICLSAFTTAKRSEIFTITTAYVALDVLPFCAI